MLVQNHKIRLRESLAAIAWAVGQGAKAQQSTLGFHITAAAVGLLNIYLHQENLLDTTGDVQHRRLRSPQRLAEALPFDFPNKARVIELLVAIEDRRDQLCYGRPRPEAEVQAVVATFGELRELFRSMGANEL